MKKITIILLALILLTSAALSLSACNDKMPETDEEAMEASTEKMLLYFIKSGTVQSNVLWEAVSSNLITEETLEARVKRDYTQELEIFKKNHEVFSELLTRNDLKKELEAFAKELLKTATKEKPNPINLVAFKYVLNQDSIEALIKGDADYPSVQKIYADMVRHSNSSGVYYGPHDEGIDYD